MKNLTLIVLLLIGSLVATSASAQCSHHCWKAEKKEYKMCKKSGKIHRKMFNDRVYAAARKHRKACKKHYKMHMKEDNCYWW
jgi:hypothetical protein